MFTFASPLWQTVAAAAIVLGTLFAAWLVAPLVRFVFGRLLGVYHVYRPRPPEWEDDPAHAHAERLARYRYAHASWWRTSFWEGVIVLLVVFTVLTGLILGFWMVHSDFVALFWYSFGLTTLVALLGLAQFFTNATAFLWHTFVAAPVRVGDYVEVGDARGEIVAFGWLSTELRDYFADVADTGYAREALRPLDAQTGAPLAADAADVRARTARQSYVPNAWLLFQHVRVHRARLHQCVPLARPLVDVRVQAAASPQPGTRARAGGLAGLRPVPLASAEPDPHATAHVAWDAGWSHA